MAHQRIILRDEGGTDHEVTTSGPDSATIGDRTITIRSIRAGELRVGEQTIWTASLNDTRWVFVNGSAYTFQLQRKTAPSPRPGASHDDHLSAPMPATVVKVHVSPGDDVKAGQLLIVLEAMKMELPVRAVSDARVEAVRCRDGELVQPGQPLIDLTPHPHSVETESDRK